MAFDLMISDRHVWLDESQGEVFDVPDDFGNFPVFRRIEDSPCEEIDFSPDEANMFLHELITIRTIVIEARPEYNYLVRLIDRYLPLLSTAYCRKDWVRSLGD